MCTQKTNAIVNIHEIYMYINRENWTIRVHIYYFSCKDFFSRCWSQILTYNSKQFSLEYLRNYVLFRKTSHYNRAARLGSFLCAVNCSQKIATYFCDIPRGIAARSFYWGMSYSHAEDDLTILRRVLCVYVILGFFTLQIRESRTFCRCDR